MRLSGTLGRPWSLRARATALAVLVFAVLLVAAGLLLVSTLESRLTAASDDLAATRAADLLDAAARGVLPATLRVTGEEGVAQVVGPDGEVLAASPNVADAPALGRPPPTGTTEVRTVRAPDDDEVETYRVAVAAGAGPEGPVTAYVGNGVEAVKEASATLRRVTWIGVPLVVSLLGLVTFLVLGRVLRRLDRIRAEVDTITDRRLDRRVGDDGAGDEVGRLARTMNAMLSRLEAAARAQRDLVADVSHDLQSPLAAQRISLELALRNPAGVDVGRLRDEVLSGNAQMERLVADLLVLAATERAVEDAPVPLDLDELVLEEAARARSATGVEVDTTAVSAAPARGHPDDVRRVVRNLLDNAVGHARSRVELRCVPGDPPVAGSAAGPSVLEVVDDGPGVPVEHRDRVFDRFHRVDAARSPGSRRSGSGLGLAIARRLAERSGGRLVLAEAAAGEGARFRLELPAC